MVNLFDATMAESVVSTAISSGDYSQAIVSSGTTIVPSTTSTLVKNPAASGPCTSSVIQTSPVNLVVDSTRGQSCSNSERMSRPLDAALQAVRRQNAGLLALSVARQQLFSDKSTIPSSMASCAGPRLQQYSVFKHRNESMLRQMPSSNVKLTHGLAQNGAAKEAAAVEGQTIPGQPSELRDRPSVDVHQLPVTTSVMSGHWSSAMSSSACTQQTTVETSQKETPTDPMLLHIQTARLQALLHGIQQSAQMSDNMHEPLVPPARRHFACDSCGKVLSSQHNLRLHVSTIHRGLFQFHCPICNKGLRQERDLRGHMANRHDWKKEYRCSVCGHEFGYKRNLKHHVMSHHGRASLDE